MSRDRNSPAADGAGASTAWTAPPEPRGGVVLTSPLWRLREMHTQGSPARIRAIQAAVYLAGLAVLTGLSRASWMFASLFVIFPLLWTVQPTRSRGVLVNVLFSVGIVVAVAARPGQGVKEALADGAFSLLVTLFIGLWFWNVYETSARLATALANERVAREALARTQGELAAAERAAGRAAEHQRWAREVHDTLAQGFISVITLSQAARSELEPGRDLAVGERLDQVEAIARDNLAEARALVAGEGPSALRDGGLKQALRRLVQSHTWHGLDLEADLRPPQGLARGTEVVVLRAVQEALSNIVRHAQAGQARVLVASERLGAGRELVVTVTDDGRGVAGQPEGTGLTGMRSRVESLGGTLTVDPVHPPDARGFTGTVLEVRMPL